MKTAIIKYNAGNTQSVIYALQRLGANPILTDKPEELLSADKIIFPGVGEASVTMREFRQTGLDKLLPALQQPVLGICLGLQLMCAFSEEGNTEGLGIFDVNVKKFDSSKGFRVPHMGWNSLQNTKSKLFEGFTSESDVYFVHSFYAELSQYTSATGDYLLPFSAALEKDNFYAVQFHPEKSGPSGSLLLQNFLKI